MNNFQRKLIALSHKTSKRYPTPKEVAAEAAKGAEAIFKARGSALIQLGHTLQYALEDATGSGVSFRGDVASQFEDRLRDARDKLSTLDRALMSLATDFEVLARDLNRVSPRNAHTMITSSTPTPREVYDAALKYLDKIEGVLASPRTGGINPTHDLARETLTSVIQKAVNAGLIPTSARQKINRKIRSVSGLESTFEDQDKAFIEISKLVKVTMARRIKKLERASRIEDDTAILPGVVAESVVHEVVTYLTKNDLDDLAGKLYRDQQKFIKALWEKAQEVYAGNSGFKEKIRQRNNRGRDTLYSFMRHWFVDLLYKDPSYRQLEGVLPSSYAMGHELRA